VTGRKIQVRCIRRTGLVLWLLAVVLLPAGSAAQQVSKVYRIGYLSPGPVQQPFRQGLRELGYVEGKNLIIEHRQGPERFPELAAELVRLKVDCILAVGVDATRAAKQATSTIPIVMGNSSDDPVHHGFVSSLARPGGNITGLVDMLLDLAGKRLELLRETLPKLTRIAHLSAQGSPPGVAHLKEVETVARPLGVRVQALQVAAPGDLENAFRSVVEGRANALIVVGVNFFIPYQKRILSLQLKTGLPAMHTHASWVSAGGLMSYTTDGAARYRRAASYVDRVLKGTNPADLPVERPTKFELVINLKTAKQIHLTIPPNVLARADRVIR
jgi:putative ABC transport system substrate-binding protein